MSSSNNFDHGRWAKNGFFLGVSLLLLGAFGEILGHLVFGGVPGWENTLFVYSEGVGVLIGFFSPFIFGIVLPLTK